MPPRETCRLRPLEEGDLDQVLAWRNSDRIRAVSFSDHVIAPAEHRAWFDRVRQRSDMRSFVFEIDEKPMGVVNVTKIDAVRRTAEWGFYVGDENAPRGAGLALGFLALEMIFETLPVDRVVGQALASNDASQNFHVKLGFAREPAYQDVAVFTLGRASWETGKERLRSICFQGGSTLTRP